MFHSSPYAEAEFAVPESRGVYPPELDDQPKWMGAVGQ
jgi:hypothetical protein